MGEVILRVTDIKKYFPIRGGFFDRVLKWVKAVDGVSFTLEKGRTLGLVGESGCGKTTLGKCIVRLLEPDSGRIEFKRINILDLSAEKIKRMRAEVQMVYQDPRSSLDPRMTVREIVAEGLRVHYPRKGQIDMGGKVKAALEAVGLSHKDAARYPHMFSGGQQQRIGVARALILNPSLMVLDEPTSALDASVQAKLFNLFSHLRAGFDLTFLFISHDMRAIRAMSDRTAVMYLGKILEEGSTESIFEDPRHPYTKALMSALPLPDPTRPLTELVKITGEPPDPSNIPPGCRFEPRCREVVGDICATSEPEPVYIDEEHYVACHKYNGKREEVISSKI